MASLATSRAFTPLRRTFTAVVAFVVAVSTVGAVGPPAVAAPAPPAAAPAAPPVTNEAADIPSARATATVHKMRVEALSERTENSSTFVNADGKLSTDLHAGPVRTKRGDAWVTVDLTLEKRSDGTIAPKAHPRDLVIAAPGGKPGENRDLAVVKHGDTEVALQWQGTLPEPKLEGRKATYRDVRPGADLVVEATRTGFEQFLVLKERPKSPVQLTLPLRTKNATAQRKDDGNTDLVDASGTVVGSIPKPEMWDARRDERSGDPAKRVPVGMELAPGLATRAAGQAITDLKLTADEAFLKAKDTQYPVVVDPVVDLGPTYDKYVQTGTTADTGGAAELRLGTFDGGATVARSYFNFDMSQFRGRRIHSARLNLYEWHAWSCSARDWEIWDTGLVGSGTNWNSQPPWYTRWSTTSETKGYSASCNDGWVSGDIRGLVQLAADNGSGTVGVMAKAANEKDNFGWKKFDSAQAGGVPHLTVDYNSRPDPATGLDVSDRGDSNGQTYTRSTTPTLSFRPSDPDGGTVTAVFYIYDGDTMVKDNWVWGVPSGSVATWKVPDGILQPGKTYRFRATTFDSHDWAADGFNSLRPVHSGKAVDIAGCSTAQGAIAQQWDYSGAGCQRFALVGTGDGYYMLRARHSDQVLDVTGCGNVEGTQIQQWPGNGNDCQKWRLEAVGNGEYKLTAKHSGLVMDIQNNSTANGQKLWTWTWNGCGCQKFRLDPAADPGVNIQWLQFGVDTQDPGAPFVSSTDYPNDNKWHKGANQAGAFTFTPPTGTADVHSYLWALDAVPTTEVAAGADGKASPSITPTTDGQHTLNVRTKDRSGRLSGVSSYTFHVGRAGLLRPAEGARVPRRVQLQVDGESAFTHVKFVWRRGPGAAVETDIPPANLTKADGSALGTGYVPLTSFGDFAVWNAVDTLGEAAGVVQVKAVLAGDGTGTGAYSTAWRTAVVDPSADTAAGVDIGPGSVNLLTGDYSLRSTDAEEFGLSVSRTSSSRDPKAGYQLQRQRLTANQQKVATDTAGFTASAATIARNTERGHESTDSLEVTPSGSGNDTFASVEGDMNAGLRLGMKAGRTYRVTGWVYVPAATGLQPDFGRGLKISAFAKTGAGYQEWSSARPSAVDVWQQLTLDFTVPKDATEAFVRLYNGFAAGSGKKVYFDDLSLREITAPFGPHWETGAEVDSAQIDYTRLTFPQEDTVQVEQADGSSIWFTRTPDGRFWPEPGAEDLTLAKEGETYRLAELDGSLTTFAKPAGTDTFLVENATPPEQAGTTRFSYENLDDQLRIKRVIAPQEPGIGDCTATTPARGCEVLEYDYATSTTATGSAFGDVTGQIRAIAAWTTDPATGAVSKVDVVRYAYDDKGRLREVWDPRLAQPLKTGYAYDDAGHITELGQPGDLPWRFDFGKAGSGDENTGRLLKVRRDTLRAATKDQVDGEITTTVVYSVPLKRGSGGPYDLDAAAIATWAQSDAPTDAVAVFGPEDPVGLHTATAQSPGTDGYRAATVHYLNASGKQVNTATPGGYIDTSEYDRFGNVVRQLESANRALALGQYPNADAQLSNLGLAQYDSRTRATWLDTRSTYSGDGLDLVETVSPLHRIALANDASKLVNARGFANTVYDEGKPDGVAYHVPTTERSGARVVGVDGDQDVRVNKTEYGPQYGGTSGWTLRKPTKVITGAEGSEPLEASTKYDAQGRARESRKIGSDGSDGTDAGTTRSIFYTAGANPDDAACGNRPEWAGQACVVRAVGAITGHDSARMVGDVPVRRVESYTRFGEPDRITETVAGKSRTTVNTYDGADRLTGTKITGDVGEAIQQIGTDYDTVSGDALTTTFADGTKVSREFDRLGRLMRYTDADGAWTATEFDRFGKPAKITDSLGANQVFAYDRAAEPRGLLTSITDSVGGATTARYGPDGQIVGMDLPGGVRMDQQLDPAGVPVARDYRKGDALVASSSVVENAQGQWLRHTGPGSDKRFGYDQLGRLTKVEDTSATTGLCTTRTYAFDRRTNRTGKSTRAGTTAGACPGDGEPAQTETHTYDSADRLTDAGWVYDAFGRIVSTPGGVQNSFYVNDLVRSQQTADARMTWSLDPALRQRSFTAEKLVNGAWANAVTKVNHYADDSDEPRWIAEDVTQANSVTRNVSSPDGDLVFTTSLTGDVTLQLTNLHGDVMATVPVASGQLGAVTVLDYDEYGAPAQSSTARYGWLGGKQRSAEALGGVVLMGVRLYHPGTGRFWQVDPEEGGNATAYDYCAGDPINCTDLDGRWGWLKRIVSVVAKVAEVVSYIPGPIGAVAGAVSAVAYAATGNYAKAAEMAITAAANLVGAGAAVKAGVAAIKAAARTVPKAASRAVKAVRSAASRGRAGCHSFVPETPVLLADGTAKAIQDVRVGDLVLAVDPKTGVSSAKPVVDVVVGFGTKHLVGIDLDPSTPDELTATAHHPIWVEGRGWVPAGEIQVGDKVRGSDGAVLPVAATADYGQWTDTLVYDLNVSETHTFQVVSDGENLTVHNATSCPLIGKGAWKHIYDRHVSSMPRWAHKSKFTTQNKNKVEKLIRRTITHGTPARQGKRTVYTMDHGRTVGTHATLGRTSRIRVVVHRGKVKTAFPFHR
jgi:RHS repeat-associated protein